jgi:hypothetical protein
MYVSKKVQIWAEDGSIGRDIWVGVTVSKFDEKFSLENSATLWIFLFYYV